MLELKQLSKTYNDTGKKVVAFENISFNVNEGEFIALLGPSGCGKSTLLKILAGLTRPDSGKVLIDGKEVTAPGQERGIVFQSFNLFPWLSVKENIAFPLKLREQDAKTIEHTVLGYLKATGLENFSHVFPKNLSGGMQQRVAIARTLASDPKILLMDEPFGSLDSQTRSQMQEFLTELWQKNKKTIVFVTHDIREALFLADKIYVLSPRPMTIKQIVDVPFARPRNHNLKREKEFFEKEMEIEEMLTT
jgi:NitT/TauT family transport system ATP-binding protein